MRLSARRHSHMPLQTSPSSLLALRRLQHGLLLLVRQLLQAVGLLLLLLLLHALLRLLLRLQALLTLLRRALHAPLGVGLVAHEPAVHALHGHLPGAASLLDAIPVVLVHLIVPGVILGLRHFAPWGGLSSSATPTVKEGAKATDTRATL